MSKYYAVANGKQTGIFNSWSVTEPLVKGYRGAKYKSFKTLHEAQQYLGQITPDKVSNPLYPSNSDNNCNVIFEESINNSIIVYTDGSCANKRGGYGYLVIYNDMVVPVSGRVPNYPTTNQVAELYAIYAMLSHVIQHYKDIIIQNGLLVFTDSKYSIGCLTEWHYAWIRNGWRNSKGESVANQKLIQSILNLSVGLKIEYRHVKAHNGDRFNEWADQLASEGRLS